MIVSLHHFIVLVSSFAVALPPGICCWTAHEGRTADPVPVQQTTCCHQTPADELPCPQKVPLKPSIKCSCTLDAVLTEKQDQNHELPALL